MSLKKWKMRCFETMLPNQKEQQLDKRKKWKLVIKNPVKTHTAVFPIYIIFSPIPYSPVSSHKAKKSGFFF